MMKFLLLSRIMVKEIAQKLAISENTIKSYVAVVLQKLNVADRTQAAIYAVQKGLVKLEE